MCTIIYGSCEFADCFREVEKEGMTPCGCAYTQCTASQCTRHKLFKLDDLEVRVQVPSVDDLKCRTACCGGYCGLALAPCVECCATRQKCTLCGCCDGRTACSCLGAGDDRACCKGISVGKDCSCDHPTEPASVVESLRQMTCCCCCKVEQMFRWTCCVRHNVCIYGRCQECCIYCKCSLPCNDEVPCEIGCCGLFCFSKKEAIRVYEIKNPTEVGYNRVQADGAPVVPDDHCPQAELVQVTPETMDKRTQ